jgi:hypothetical protein
MAARVLLREITSEEGNRPLRIVRRTSGSHAGTAAGRAGGSASRSGRPFCGGGFRPGLLVIYTCTRCMTQDWG